MASIINGVKALVKDIDTGKFYSLSGEEVASSDGNPPWDDVTETDGELVLSSLPDIEGQLIVLMTSVSETTLTADEAIPSNPIMARSRTVEIFDDAAGIANYKLLVNNNTNNKIKMLVSFDNEKWFTNKNHIHTFIYGSTYNDIVNRGMTVSEFNDIGSSVLYDLIHDSTSGIKFIRFLFAYVDINTASDANVSVDDVQFQITIDDDYEIAHTEDDYIIDMMNNDMRVQLFNPGKYLINF